MQVQGPGEIPQGQALLVQIIVGVPHPEIPDVGVLQLLLMGLHQADGPAEQGPAVQCLGISEIVAGPGQFHVGVGSALFGGQGFDGIEDFLVLVVDVPHLALFQQRHGEPPLAQGAKRPQKIHRYPEGRGVLRLKSIRGWWDAWRVPRWEREHIFLTFYCTTEMGKAEKKFGFFAEKGNFYGIFCRLKQCNKAKPARAARERFGY